MRRAAVQCALLCAVLALFASCSSHHSSTSTSTGPAPTGTIVGTITSSLGGSITGVSVVVTPNGGSPLAAVTTSTSGAFVAASVPATPDDGALTLSSLPSNCTAPAPTYTGLTGGDTVTVNVTVICSPMVGTLTGTVTSSLGGALSGVSVVVTPTGGSALPAVTTTTNGGYTVHNVPVGGGAVTLTGGLPLQCSAPSAVAYTGLAYNKTDTTNVVATCQTSGTLAVQVVEPATALGAVTVTGPGNYVRTITQTTTLTGLVPGSYAVTAAPFETTDAIVGTVWSGSGNSPVQVTAGTTTRTTVTYSARAGSGGLWVIMPDYSNIGGTWGYFSSAQLAAGGNQTMAFSTAIPGDVQVNGMAVDANGTMWMVDNNNGALDAFTAASGFQHPTSIDTLLPMFNYALYGAAFDPAGNLWTMNDDAGLVELTTAQLAAGGNTSPRFITYVGTLFPDLNSRALTFDASGTLWLLSRHEPNASLEAFTQAQLNAGGSQSPSISILLPDSQVRALAFDASGNLWVSLFRGQKIAKYTPGQLAAGGSPTPTITIGVPNPSGVAFDASGNLWVVDAVDGQLFELTASQLTASGTPTPAITMALPVASNSFNPQQPFYLVFDPHPSTLPLNGSKTAPRRVIRRSR